MKRNIYIALKTCFLMLMLFSAIAVSSNAQPKQNKSKPDGKAKKLVEAGNQLFVKKDFRGAINKYAEAIVISPSYPEAHFWKGGAHYYLNEFEPAAEELDKAYDQGYPPDKIYPWRWEANYNIKNYDAALNDAQNGLKKDPRNVQMLLGTANIYRAKGDNAKAIESYKKVLEVDPKNADVYYFMAATNFALGNTEQQEVLANDALKRNTYYVYESYLLLADAAQKLKKPDEAIQAYERVLNLKPEQPPTIFVALSDLYRSQSRLSEAISTARKGIKLHPNDGSLFVSLTWYYSLADRPNEAVTAGQQAVKYAADADKQMANTNLCRAYNDAKMYPQAIAACNSALKINADDGETNYYLGRAYDSQDKFDTAKPYYVKAVAGLLETVRNNPEYSDGYYLLGNAYYSTDQIDKAIEAYKQCLKLSPNFAKGNLNLGIMYVKKKNFVAAREQYATLLKIDTTAAEKLRQAIDGK